MTLPEKYTIPKERIPKAWSQGVYNCCVAASITKVLEVINYLKTGKYVMFSKGYVYGKHSRPDKTQGGMDYIYAMEMLLKYGTVPEEMYSEMDEIPNIIDKVNSRSDLNKEAEKTRIKSYTRIKGDIHFYENVKKYLYEYNMPLVANMVGKRHCTVVVGWDGDNLLYHDHKGTDKLYEGRFNEAYYLDGDIEVSKTMPFTDVHKDDWFYDDVECAYNDGIIQGITDTTFEPNKPLTRAEFCALYRRIKELKKE